MSFNKHPVITSYRGPEDLAELRGWFYGRGDADRRRAVQRVKALALRGRLPHAVEATSQLTAVALLDPLSAPAAAALVAAATLQSDSTILQLSYSMLLVRFVNGLLDPFQQSSFAIPLHQLARNLGLPSLFVELRHMGTHEQLPSLDTLRMACRRALDWLYTHYWSTLESTADNPDGGADAAADAAADDDDDDAEYTRLSLLCREVAAEIKTYKKVRKLDLDREYKFGNSSSAGKRYWRAVAALKRLSDADRSAVARTFLYRDVLVYNAAERGRDRTKLNPLLLKLYRPLLAEMGAQFRFELLWHIWAALNGEGGAPSALSERLGFVARHPAEAVQWLGWARHLTADLLLGPATALCTPTGAQLALKAAVAQWAMQRTAEHASAARLELLEELLRLSAENNLQRRDVEEQILGAVAAMRQRVRESLLAAAPTLEELVSGEDATPKGAVPKENVLETAAATPPEEEVLRKRHKPQTHFFFEEVPDWVPTPFGTAV